MGTIQTTITQRQTFMGEKKLYANIVSYSNINSKKLIDYMVANSGINKSTAIAAVYALRSILRNYLCNGHTVQIPELGTFSLRCTAKAQADKKDVKASTVKHLKIRFTPEATISNAVKSVKFKGIVNPKDTLDVITD